MGFFILQYLVFVCALELFSARKPFNFFLYPFRKILICLWTNNIWWFVYDACHTWTNLYLKLLYQIISCVGQELCGFPHCCLPRGALYHGWCIIRKYEHGWMRTKVGFPPLARSYLLENGDKFSDLCHLYLSFPYIQSNMNHNSGLKRRVLLFLGFVIYFGKHQMWTMSLDTSLSLPFPSYQTQSCKLGNDRKVLCKLWSPNRNSL